VTPAMNKVAAFYQFVGLERPDAVHAELLAHCTGLGLSGTILVSPEGINGTLAGAPENIDAFVEILRGAAPDRPAFERLELKFSSAGAEHFDRLKIRVKREIITFGQQLDPAQPVGRHVPAREWNRLLEDPDVLLVDTRNGFEVEMGSFDGAIDPGLTSFSAFKEFVDTRLSDAKDRKIAMFCTGGIRCEKASAYMIEAGFSDVFQLEGGILRYLEEVPEADSKWRGDCFVFDQRVALGQGLAVKTSNHHPNLLDTARATIAE
jgi:UPF0176 protein